MRVLLIEIVILCAVFLGVCYLGTGTDQKNLKNYSSNPDKVQNRIQEIAEYRGKFKETGKARVLAANFLVFTVLFLLLGIPIRQENFSYNFICLLILGQSLNVFDLFVIDLLWWRNSERIRLSKIPQKELYRDPKKHIEAFIRALMFYFFVALVDGYLLTLF